MRYFGTHDVVTNPGNYGVISVVMWYLDQLSHNVGVLVVEVWPGAEVAAAVGPDGQDVPEQKPHLSHVVQQSMV